MGKRERERERGWEREREEERRGGRALTGLSDANVRTVVRSGAEAENSLMTAAALRSQSGMAAALTAMGSVAISADSADAVGSEQWAILRDPGVKAALAGMDR